VAEDWEIRQENNQRGWEVDWTGLWSSSVESFDISKVDVSYCESLAYPGLFEYHTVIFISCTEILEVIKKLTVLSEVYSV
jgi:hypothetical protein